MPRSYFSQITRPGGAPPLLPRRPLSSLWKAARLERLAGEPATQAPEFGPSPVETSAPIEAAPRRMVRGRRESAPDSRDTTAERWAPLVPESRLAAKTTSLALASPATIAVRPPASGRRDLEGQAAAASRTQISQSVETATRPENARPRRVRADQLDARPNGPIRDRATHLPGDAPSGTVAGEPGNSVHIGKIDVQIVPPPAPTPRPRASTPRTRLARGYSLWASGQTA